MSTVVRTMNAEGLVGTFPELIDATVDTIRLARGRLTARGALVLAREIYSCALNECKDEISVAVGVTTVLQGLGGFNATICLAMAKEGEQKMFDAIRARERGNWGGNGKNTLIDEAIRARAKECLTLRAEGDELGLWTLGRGKAMAEIDESIREGRKGALVRKMLGNKEGGGKEEDKVNLKLDVLKF